MKIHGYYYLQEEYKREVMDIDMEIRSYYHGHYHYDSIRKIDSPKME